MERLRSGEISQVDMNVMHRFFYKTNYIVKSSEWNEILRTAYVWFDWGSMPQPSASPDASKEEREEMETDLGNGVKSSKWGKIR